MGNCNFKKEGSDNATSIQLRFNKIHIGKRSFKEQFYFSLRYWKRRFWKGVES